MAPDRREGREAKRKVPGGWGVGRESGLGAGVGGLGGGGGKKEETCVKVREMERELHSDEIY